MDTASNDAGPTTVPISEIDTSIPVGRLMEETAAAFEGMNMPLARRWAETLVSAVIDVPHADLGAHAGRVLSPEERARFREISRRASPDEPLAYVIGRAPFLEWDFEVSRDTLIPKVDTELFVGAVLEELSRRPLSLAPHVLELGTGSGCLAISLAKMLPEARMVATDISPEALAVADRNVARYGLEGRFALGLGDLFGPVADLAGGRPFDLVVSNPPYIPTENIPGMGRHVAEHEPFLALDGGADGLSPHGRIFEGAADYLAPGGRVLLEHEWYHGRPARTLAERHPDVYDDVRTLVDANGRDRAVHARRRTGTWTP